MKNRITRLVALALLLFAVMPAFAQLPQKLAQFSNISGIKKLEVSDKMENPFKEKYVMFPLQDCCDQSAAQRTSHISP